MRNYLILKSTLLQRESFPTMCYTVNSSPMLVTKLVSKLIFVLSNYQTCTFPLRRHKDRTITWQLQLYLGESMYSFWKKKNMLEGAECAHVNNCSNQYHDIIECFKELRHLLCQNHWWFHWGTVDIQFLGC